MGRLLELGLVVALLAGCGPAAQSAAVPPAQIQAHRSSSSCGPLVYVSTLRNVDIFTYPQGQQIGTLSGFYYSEGLCSDANGNVFVTDYYDGTIVEYAHGGTSPIATLQDAGAYPFDCAIDKRSGDLAVGNQNATIAVYKKAQGSPTYYSTRGFMGDVRTIAYDHNGNLYFASFKHHKSEAWLPEGSSQVMRFHVAVNGVYRFDPQGYLAIRTKQTGGEVINRYKVSGSNGHRIGQVQLYNCAGSETEFTFFDLALVAVCGGANISTFAYPRGGNATISFSTGQTRITGMTISVAPSRK